MIDDELRTLRRRVTALESRAAVTGPDPTPGTFSRRGQVYNAGSMPTSVPGAFAVHPVKVTGAESEGAAVAFSANTTQTFYMTAIGPGVPVAGDVLTGHLIGGRWVAGMGRSTAAGVNQVYTVRGCNNMPLAGALVQVKDGSTVKASGTTDASGNVTLKTKPVLHTVVISKARFDTLTTFFVTGSGFAFFTLTPSSSYVCTFYCADPLPLSLLLTDTKYGPVTLTWQPGTSKWFGNKAVAFPAQCGCVAQAHGVMAYSFFPNSVVQNSTVYAAYLNNIQGIPFCPSDIAYTSVSMHWTFVSSSCGPFVGTFKINTNPAVQSQNIYCDGDPTYIVTEP
jgi:hypothetical protein